ncbi:MAG: KEOPS complex subunit Pcc1 [Candidatus Nanohaloarchaea archaeon]|nr:KEOPS complex subunit Pcc1 [Candidatus Nanohaloarchaea archaeon]
MEAELHLDVVQPQKVRESIGSDLRDSDRVTYRIDTDGSGLTINVEAASLGVLRGALNTAMKLTKLSTQFTREA